MATVPSTIVVFTEDKVNFPLKWAMVVIKQLFQYGVNKISLKDEKIFIELSYTPIAQKLKAKFGTLPLRYMRVKIDNPEEFRILEKVVKRYRFNLIDEAGIEPGPSIKTYPTFSLEEDEGINLLDEVEEC